MLQRIAKHKHLGYFTIYSVSMLLYGASINFMGPIIPYLSAQTHLKQTDYSILISLRAFGMFTGAALFKVLQQTTKLSNHNYIAMGSFFLGSLMALFSMTYVLWWEGVWMFGMGMMYIVMEVPLTICVLKTTPKEDMEFWMLMLHGTFGLGNGIGPFIVLGFQVNSFLIVGVLTIVTVPVYFISISPEINQAHSTDQQQVSEDPPITGAIEVMLCLSLFLDIGMQMTFAGWISSFSILQGVNTKQEATIYPAIFWGVMTVFRFVLAFLPGKSSQKLRRLIQITIIAAVLSLGLVACGLVKFTCYLSSILLGISLSSLFPLIFSIATEFGWRLDDDQTNKIVAAGVLGQGILAMIAGKLMGYYGDTMLFYSIIVFALIIWGLVTSAIQRLMQLPQRHEMDIELVPKQTLNKAKQTDN